MKTMRLLGVLVATGASASMVSCSKEPTTMSTGGVGDPGWSVSENNDQYKAASPFTVTVTGDPRTYSLDSVITFGSSGRGRFTTEAVDVRSANQSVRYFLDENVGTMAITSGNASLSLEVQATGYVRYRGRDFDLGSDTEASGLAAQINEDPALRVLPTHIQGVSKYSISQADLMYAGASRGAVWRFIKKVFKFIFDHVDASCTWSTKDGRTCKVGTR